MKNSKEALALREKRNSDIRAAYWQLRKLQTMRETDINEELSTRFYLLPRQLQYIVRGSLNYNPPQ